MAERQQSFNGELFGVQGATITDGGVTTPKQRLWTLEHEHRELSTRRRRLHESIDMLESLDDIRRDAQIWLEKYRQQETKVSRLRQELYREILNLRREYAAPDSGREVPV